MDSTGLGREGDVRGDIGEGGASDEGESAGVESIESAGVEGVGIATSIIAGRELSIGEPSSLSAAAALPFSLPVWLGL